MRSVGLEYPDAQMVGKSYIGLLFALEVPEKEVRARVAGVVSGSVNAGSGADAR